MKMSATAPITKTQRDMSIAFARKKGATIKAIAQKFGLGQQQVRQVIGQAGLK